MMLDLSPKLIELFCELKTGRIKEEYSSLDKKYRQTDELFDLPETKERNNGIATSYSELRKEAENFYRILDHAGIQVKAYEIRLRVMTAISALSKKICQKNLDQMVSTEWTRDIGRLALYEQKVYNTKASILDYRIRVNSLLSWLKLGMGCMDGSLEKEKQALMNYVQDLGEKKRELESLKECKGKIRPDFFDANIKSLSTCLVNMHNSIKSKPYHIQSLAGCACFYRKISESPEKIEEWDKKLILTLEMLDKYDKLKKINEQMLKDPLLEGQPFLIFKN